MHISSHKLVRIRVLTVFMIILSAAQATALPAKAEMPVHTMQQDTADVCPQEKKAFWRTAAEVAGFNVGLWAFDRYVLNGHYAYISWNTIKENFRHGFDWDNDHLNTNMFAHPYNGSLFYNAARSNGYNFWQSELFAIGGSAMWELFMECEYPSTNDIIATPIGGAALGEVFFRTSDMILDERASGGERFGRELAAFIISPMRGINRIITGQAWKRNTQPGRKPARTPVSLTVSAGPRIMMYQPEDGYYTQTGATAGIHMEYGDRFGSSSKVPYDYFSLLAELNAIKGQPLLNRIEIVGRLLSKELVDTKKSNLAIGMYQHFDFFDSDTVKRKSDYRQWPSTPCAVPYKLGTPASVGAGLTFRHIKENRWTFEAYTHLNGIILGGILSDFYRFYNRNYNWASGLSLKFGFNWLLLDGRLSVSLSDRFYKLYSWNSYSEENVWTPPASGEPMDIQGDKSNATFNHLETKIDCRLWKGLYLTAGMDWYARKSTYHHRREFHGENFNLDSAIQLITSRQLNFRLMLTYKL